MPVTPMLALPPIPAATGPHLTGARIFERTDAARNDPFDLYWPYEKRRMVFTVWYPTEDSGTPMKYLSETTSRDTSIASTFCNALQDSYATANMQAKYTRSTLNAAVKSGTYPVVLLANGLGLLRLHYAALAEELASHGYIVIAMDATYDAIVVEFSTGLVGQYPGTINANYFRKATNGRIGDIQYMLANMAGLPNGVGAAINTNAIALAGHSIGTLAALWVAEHGGNVESVVALDGVAGVPGGTLESDFIHLLTKPTLSLSVPAGSGTGAGVWHPSWGPVLENENNAELFDVRVDDTEHYSFCDLVTELVTQKTYLTGTLDVRAIEITRAYVKSFLDYTLKGAGQCPSLTAPDTDFPEVQIFS